MILSGPICPDPDPSTFKYGRPRGGSLSARVDYDMKSRIKPEAKTIADMHKGSIGLIFGLEQNQIKTGWKSDPPKDHYRENLRRMRLIQKTAKLKQQDKEMAKSVPVKVLPQTMKYSSIPSKVSLELSIPQTPRPNSNLYLRAHSKTGGRTPRPDSPNFVVHNKQVVEKVAESRKNVVMKKFDDKLKQDELENHMQSRKGHVPGYLRSMQRQWVIDERKRVQSIPDPNMPPGHRELSEAERLETLKTLKSNHSQVEKQMLLLPITPDTLRMKTKRSEMENRLLQLEEAIKVFERTKVFVRKDETSEV